jgi:hypothetical protein
MAPHLVLSIVQIEVEVEVEAAAVEVASRRGSRALPRYVLDNEPTVSAGIFFSRENMLYQQGYSTCFSRNHLCGVFLLSHLV